MAWPCFNLWLGFEPPTKPTYTVVVLLRFRSNFALDVRLLVGMLELGEFRIGLRQNQGFLELPWWCSW